MGVPVSFPTTQLGSVSVFSGTCNPVANGIGPATFSYRVMPPASMPNGFPLDQPTEIYITVTDSNGVIYPVSCSSTTPSASSVVLQIAITRPIPISSFGSTLTLTIQLDYGQGYGTKTGTNQP